MTASSDLNFNDFLSFRILDLSVLNKRNSSYRKVASSNTSRLEAHTGIYRLLMKGIFDAHVLRPFAKE